MKNRNVLIPRQGNTKIKVQGSDQTSGEGWFCYTFFYHYYLCVCDVCECKQGCAKAHVQWSEDNLQEMVYSLHPEIWRFKLRLVEQVLLTSKPSQQLIKFSLAGRMDRFPWH